MRVPCIMPQAYVVPAVLDLGTTKPGGVFGRRMPGASCRVCRNSCNSTQRNVIVHFGFAFCVKPHLSSDLQLNFVIPCSYEGEKGNFVLDLAVLDSISALQPQTNFVEAKNFGRYSGTRPRKSHALCVHLSDGSSKRRCKECFHSHKG